jgi:uncharacterized repeat protein (TIGR03803 family)
MTAVFLPRPGRTGTVKFAVAGLIAGALMLAHSSGALADPRFDVLHDFTFKDGAVPDAGLVWDKGELYGTTRYGGGTWCEGAGCGVVFKLTPPAPGKTGWTETVLYRFKGTSDGHFPNSTLVVGKSGVLYGTASNGGDSAACPYYSDDDTDYDYPGCGVVFSLTPPAAGKTDWTEAVIYRFTGRSDGAFPFTGESDGGVVPGGLVADKSGALYGTTSSGGDSAVCPPYDGGTPAGCGVVFKLTPPAPGKTAWTETVLHSFTSGENFRPNGVIMDDKGVLYGTASSGKRDLGIVFKLTPPTAGTASWTSTVLHSFTDAGDEGISMSGVVMDKAGALYGTTFAYPPKSSQYGIGVAFRLQPPAAGKTAWTETVLHSFSGKTDGADLGSLVIAKNGVLYGTIAEGVFKLTPASGTTAWTETVLHRFTAFSGGAYPSSLFLGSAGALYGLTLAGGSSHCPDYTVAVFGGGDCGLVYKLVP